MTCHACNGTGQAPCKTCNGSGRQPRDHPNDKIHPCPDCLGGYNDPCPVCGTESWLSGHLTFQNGGQDEISLLIVPAIFIGLGLLVFLIILAIRALV